jgi:hypothetical protein
MALLFAAIAFLAIAAVGAVQPPFSNNAAAAYTSNTQGSLPAKCVVLAISINSTTNAVLAKGYCMVGAKKVGVRWKSLSQWLDSQGYNCSASPVAGRTNTVRLNPPGNFKVTFAIQTVKKWSGRIISKTRSIRVSLGGDQLMCGKPPIPPLSPSVVCDWGTPPAQPDNKLSYCGLVYWFRGEHVPVPAWSTKLTIKGNVVSAGHIVSPAGVCRATSYLWPPPPDSWYHIVSFNYWQCGSLAVETSFTVWLVNPQGKTCRLPDQTEGQGVMKFIIPSASSEWGDVLKVDYTLITYSGKMGFDWTGLAHEDSTAILKLPGGIDGCTQLGLPTN